MQLLSKYGVARHVYIPIVKRAAVDFAVSADWTPAAGDVKISKDGGAAANVTNLPTAITMGNTAMWDFSLTATEMQAAQVVVMVADSATKAVEDQSFIIETYGNASGQHPFDLATATQSVNVSQFGGSAGTFFAGRPEVNTSHAAGTAWNSGAIGASTLASDTITAAKIAADAITAAKIADGAIDRLTFAADTGLQTIRSNTAQTALNGSITLDASASATNDFYKGAEVYITAGTGAGQARVIAAYDGGTKVATLDRNWTTTPDNTSTFAILGQSAPKLSSALEVTAAAVTGNVAGNVTGSVGSIANGGIASASFAPGAIDATAIATDAIGSSELAASAVTEIQSGLATASALTTAQADLDDIQTRLPAALVSGRIDASVGAVATGAITAGAIAADAIGASELAADAASEIASAVRTELTTELGRVDVSISDVKNRLSTLVTKTATVQTDAGNSATQILTDLTETQVDHWAFALVKITSGTLAEQVRKCTGYDGAGTLTFTDGFTATPADGVTLELVND